MKSLSEAEEKVLQYVVLTWHGKWNEDITHWIQIKYNEFEKNISNNITNILISLTQQGCITKKNKIDGNASAFVYLTKEGSRYFEDKKKREQMILLDVKEEIQLRAILDKYTADDHGYVQGNNDLLPEPLDKSSTMSVFKTLQSKGIIRDYSTELGGNWAFFLEPIASWYFDYKDQYIEEEKIYRDAGDVTIFNTTNQFTINSTTIIISTVIQEITKKIETDGGEEKEELRALLEETKSIIKTIEESGVIPPKGKYLEKIGNHLEKHNWFYSQITDILLQVLLKRMGM